MSVLAPPPQDELELLIREARARQRRRRMKAAAAVAVVAAAATGFHAVAAGGSSNRTPAPRGRALAGGPCGVAAGWRLSVASRWSEPTMQETLPVTLTRVGSSACAVRGYPTIVLRDGRGVIPFRYSHRGDMVVARRRPHSVRVSGHGSAGILLNKTVCQTRDTRIARRLDVRLPGVRGWLRLRLPRHGSLDFCAGPAYFTTIAVSPVVARLSEAAAQP